MWGLRFHKASNTLIAASAEFSVQGRDGSQARYSWAGGPHGGTLSRRNWDGEWEKIGQGTERDIEAILPQSWGHKWTYADFLLALTFWGEGRGAAGL
jgi:hypothetical protein